MKCGDLVLEYSMYLPNEPPSLVIVLEIESDYPESIVYVLGNNGKKLVRKRLELEYP